MTHHDVDVTQHNDFETPSLPPKGKANGKVAEVAGSVFRGVSRKTAEAAKKGETSNSRTGRGKQVTYEFAKPPKNMFVKVHPSPNYSITSLPVYLNPVTNTMHYVDPELYESNELPDRFKNSCRLINVYAAAVADGTFFLWWAGISSSQWYKAAMKTVEFAKQRYGIVSSIKSRNTYSFEPTTEAIPEPKWDSLPPFEQMLQEAFDSTVTVPDDKVVLDFMSGGVAGRPDEDEN